MPSSASESIYITFTLEFSSASGYIRKLSHKSHSDCLKVFRSSKKVKSLQQKTFIYAPILKCMH